MEKEEIKAKTTNSLAQTTLLCSTDLSSKRHGRHDPCLPSVVKDHDGLKPLVVEDNSDADFDEVIDDVVEITDSPLDKFDCEVDLDVRTAQMFIPSSPIMNTGIELIVPAEEHSKQFQSKDNEIIEKHSLTGHDNSEKTFCKDLISQAPNHPNPAMCKSIDTDYDDVEEIEKFLRENGPKSLKSLRVDVENMKHQKKEVNNTDDLQLPSFQNSQPPG